MVKRKVAKIISAFAVVAMVGSGIIIPAQARNIGSFSNFTVTYTGSEKYTYQVTKSTTGRNAVINLSNDTGTAWVTANMRNSKNEYKGGTTVQRGNRTSFSNTGQGGYYYKLGVKKTNNTGGGSVTIAGSWSPDES